MNHEEISKTVKKIYHWLRHPGSSLSQRVLHGGVWSFALRIVTRSFSLIRTIVLARLLAPNDFGLFGIAMVTLSALRRFSKTGFNLALIQKKEDTVPYLDTAWTVQLIRGVILASLLIFGAPLVGIFFEEPRAVQLVRVLGASFFLYGFRNIGVVYFKKELEFHKQFAYRASGVLADLTVALTIAFIFRSVWALVLGLLAKRLIQLVFSYLVHPFRPSLEFNKEMALELFDFGKFVFIQSILLFLITQGDDVFVGRVLGATALGFYQLAYRISNVPATEITRVVSSVTYPAFSKIQDNKDALVKAIKRTLKAVSVVTMPVAGGIFIIASLFTNTILGQKWLPIIPAIQILSLFGLIRSIGAIFGPAYRAQGRPDIPLRFNVVELVLIIGTIYPLSMRWGFTGTSISVTIALLPTLYLTGWYMSKMLKVSILNLYRPLVKPLLLTITMVAVVKLARAVLPIESLPLLIVSIAVGIITYLVLLYSFGKEYFDGALKIARDIT